MRDVAREDSWSRDKQYLGTGHPMADKDGREKWVEFRAEVPPELAQMLEVAQRKALGVNYDGYSGRPINATKAHLVRAALYLYLETFDPAKPDYAEGAIEASAIDVQVRSALPSAREHSDA